MSQSPPPQNHKPKITITYGTFDLLHFGHIRLLESAKSDCDKLIVGLSTDEFNKKKGKTSYLSFEERAKLLAAIKYVDLIIPEENWEQKISDIKKFNIDRFVIGDDWKGKFDYLREYCEVIYLKRTPAVSSTLIKQAISKEDVK